MCPGLDHGAGARDRLRAERSGVLGAEADDLGAAVRGQRAVEADGGEGEAAKASRRRLAELADLNGPSTSTQVLVLAPTRELVNQINESLEPLAQTAGQLIALRAV